MSALEGIVKVTDCFGSIKTSAEFAYRRLEQMIVMSELSPGSQTTEAVRFFQRRNRLTVDGITGPQTLAALGIRVANTGGGGGSSSYTNDINLLARMISAEGRGEPYNGQVAIGAVIMNRIRHPSFPNTLAGVIYQPGAFSAINDGQFNQPTADSARRAAVDAYNGVDPTHGCLYYYAPSKTTNQWMLSRPTFMTIGNHVFTK